MTKVVFYKSDGVYYGFEEHGHTGYAVAGEDVLCAAISAMTMFVINTIEGSYGSRADYSIDEEHTSVRLVACAALSGEPDEKKRYAVGGLISAYYRQLKELETEYSDFLKITEVERRIG